MSDARKRIDVAVPGENRLIYWGVGGLVLVGAGFALLTGYAQRLETDLGDLDGRLAALNQERQQYVETAADMTAFSRQSLLAGTLLANHLFWSKAFEKIQALARPQLQLTAFSASAAKKEMTLAARAPNYTTIARQIAAFTADDAIKDLTLTGAKVSNLGGLEFGIQIQFDEAKLLKPSSVRPNRPPQ